MQWLERKIEVAEGIAVSSVWALPRDYLAASGTALVLGHGAGSDMHEALVSHLHERLAAHGVLTVKFNFPYRERGGCAPDRAPVLEATWHAVLAALRADPSLAPARLFIGGKSMGGRMATQVAAAGEPCAGLVLLGYPLHPARQPARLRAAHLRQVRAPLLFVQGTRDPLCGLTALREVLVSLDAPVVLHVVEGADHTFRVPKRSGRAPEDVCDEILAVVTGWLGM